MEATSKQSTSNKTPKGQKSMPCKKKKNGNNKRRSTTTTPAKLTNQRAANAMPLALALPSALFLQSIKGSEIMQGIVDHRGLFVLSFCCDVSQNRFSDGAFDPMLCAH
jgi:hypothetical protein